MRAFVFASSLAVPQTSLLAMVSHTATPCDITLSDQHEFLNCAREFQWDQVKRKINSEPGLVSVQPCGREGHVRWSALHQASLSGSSDAVRFLLEVRFLYVVRFALSFVCALCGCLL